MGCGSWLPEQIQVCNQSRRDDAAFRSGVNHRPPCFVTALELHWAKKHIPPLRCLRLGSYYGVHYAIISITIILFSLVYIYLMHDDFSFLQFLLVDHRVGATTFLLLYFIVCSSHPLVNNGLGVLGGP